MEKFSFDGAMMHFVRTAAPGGFLWKFLLSYFAIYSLIFLALWFLIGSVLIEFVSMGPREMERMSESEAARLFARMGIGYAMMIPLFLVAWSVIEAAIQRRYMRLAAFSVRLGADEFRLMAVALLWLLCFIGLYVVFALMMGVLIYIFAAGAGAGGGSPNPALLVVTVLIMFGLFVPLILFLVRLSPAAALTIRDRAVRFTSAWGVSKGRFWPMLGAFAIIFIVSGIASSMVQNAGLLYFVGQFAASSGFEQADDPAVILSYMASPAVWGPGMLFVLVYLGLQAVVQYAAAGVPALAARTDPKWSAPDMPERVFG
ncbi:MAG: hypothetical protein AAF216_01170 [Pseudomonadota bacterium]